MARRNEGRLVIGAPHVIDIMTLARTNVYYPICRTCQWVGTNHDNDQDANHEADSHRQEHSRRVH